MKRDGTCTSLWQDTVSAFTPAATAIPLDTVFDVLIVGGGITGISTALSLQKSGKQCVLAEAHNIGFGTTGGTTAHINTVLDHFYSEIESNFGEVGAQKLAMATKRAISLIQDNIKEYGIECGFRIEPGYIFSQDEKQSKELDKILEATQKAGVEMEYSSEIPVPIRFGKALIFSGQAKFHPTQYITGLAKAFENAGGVLLENCRIGNLEKEEHIVVESTLGTIRARQLVYATHIPPGVNLLHFRCAPYRSYAMALTLKDKNYPDALVYDMHDPYHYYRTQNVNGQDYLIAGGEDHKTGHEVNTEKCFRALESHVRKYFDVEHIAYKWSSQYFETTDGLPYIGHLPGQPEDIYVATGFGGNGITLGTVASFVLRDMIVHGKSEYQEIFDPNRLKPIAGFTNFLREQADVIKTMIGGWISSEKINGLSELAADEARVVKYENEKLAIYRDESGQLHAVNPVCPHAKCTVNWNRAEKSWDCPCHGSRFSMEGEMLTGPSRTDLEKVEVKEVIAKATS
jgi:glycine/D-amino acid oxidase-like deaminating enzyme/nitrite reductase/ring-hydroxylating ferredoxin subunit